MTIDPTAAAGDSAAANPGSTTIHPVAATATIKPPIAKRTRVTSANHHGIVATININKLIRDPAQNRIAPCVATAGHKICPVQSNRHTRRQTTKIKIANDAVDPAAVGWISPSPPTSIRTRSSPDMVGSYRYTAALMPLKIHNDIDNHHITRDTSPRDRATTPIANDNTHNNTIVPALSIVTTGNGDHSTLSNPNAANPANQPIVPGTRNPPSR